jgi:hypothetical protein
VFELGWFQDNRFQTFHLSVWRRVHVRQRRLEHRFLHLRHPEGNLESEINVSKVRSNRFEKFSFDLNRADYPFGGAISNPAFAESICS